MSPLGSCPKIKARTSSRSQLERPLCVIQCGGRLVPIISTLFAIRADMRHRCWVMEWACGRWCRIHKGLPESPSNIETLIRSLSILYSSVGFQPPTVIVWPLVCRWSLHPRSNDCYQCFMETRVYLVEPTPTATYPLHLTASMTHISPDSEQCGEDWHQPSSTLYNAQGPL